MADHRLVVVLGMHRSGTSAITRGLQALNVNLGEQLMAPEANNNDKGFFEDIEVNRLNIDLLNAIDSDWDAFSVIPATALIQERLAHYKLRAIKLIRSKVGERPFGLKDPRIARLLPFWQSVFDDAGVSASYVIAVRNPMSIAQSLKKRNGFDSEKSHFLWLGHVLPAILQTHGFRRVAVSFDLMISEPYTQLNRIARSLDLPFDAHSTGVQEYVSDFLDAKLRHAEFDLDDLRTDCAAPVDVVSAYEMLVRLACDEVKMDAPEVRELFDQLNDNLEVFRPAFNYMTHSDKRLAARDRQIASLNLAVAEREGKIAERDARMNQIYSSRSWRITQPLRDFTRHIRALKSLLARFHTQPLFMAVSSNANQGVGETHSASTVSAAIEVLKRTPFSEIQRAGYHFQANDFYSPLNDVAFLKDNLDLWKQRPSPSSIHWNTEGQLAIARKVGRYAEELRDVPKDQQPGKLEYCWNNPMWNNADALVQYGLLRDLKPKQIVEIGCGWSSLLMQRALERNQVPCQVTQIEPYPNPALFKFFPKDWQLRRTPLQRVPFEVFESLQAGDICFYDGSHCAKVASDVNWFFFEVLPRLAPGVIIHIHDIFLPDDYPDLWIFERGQTWNEQYLLQAFLMNNTDYKILIANRFLYKTNAKALEEFYLGVQPSYGCSFWMQKMS